MKPAEIDKVARIRESEAVDVTGVECLRAERPIIGDNEVGNIVIVLESDGRAGFHGQVLRRKGEIADLDAGFVGMGGQRRHGSEDKSGNERGKAPRRGTREGHAEFL